MNLLPLAIATESPLDALRAHQMFFTGVSLVLVLLHATLFVLQPRERQNLYCALFVASYGALVYSNFAFVLQPGAEAVTWSKVFLVAIACASMTWLLTLHSIYHVRKPWLLRVLGLAAVALGIWGAMHPESEYAFDALLGLTLVAGAAASWEIVRAWTARLPGARLLAIGMALLASAVIYSALRTLGLAPDTALAGFVPTYGGVGAAFSLSLFLARNYALTTRQLELKLAEVEALSAAALAHEREKRELVTALNAELEGLVLVRTSELTAEKRKSDDLLYNILPREAADELKATGRSKPQRYEDVTVLFADFKGFTNTVSAMPADRLVTELNDIFNVFDDIVDAHGLQKIKTIGDAYMVAGGIPTPAGDAAARVVSAALAMVNAIAERNRDAAVKWHMRVGVHTGIVVAGVVGKRRLIYDLFGDTVNIASRMESHGEPGRVNLSAYTYDLVRVRFRCDYLGKIEIKGKGAIDMYSVVGPHAPNDTASGGANTVPRALESA